ncbi:hypothetical protein [Bradyrhizobium sp. STM 3809]|uniref:hypothetical protein n=1 Tax=Bradyrhizobium sp. STM 3809 TaxID=551936 RepID=UPI000306579B|nr:hypothetical protein [Bradyrhizobium sp. STM 3809]
MSSGIDDSNNSGGGALHIVGSGSGQKVGVICAKGGETPLWSPQGPENSNVFCAR